MLIELGLFIGALGRNSVVAIAPAGTPIHIPSDLSGLMLARYSTTRGDGNLRAALGPACTAIIGMLERTPTREYPVPKELSLRLLAVSAAMGRRQRQLLIGITRRQTASVKQLLEQFPEFTLPELHYRLECLRLLSFVIRSTQAVSTDDTEETRQRYTFCLHPRYLDELAEAGQEARYDDTNFGFGDQESVTNRPTGYSTQVDALREQLSDDDLK